MSQKTIEHNLQKLQCWK